MHQMTIAIHQAREFRITGRYKSASFGEGGRGRICEGAFPPPIKTSR